MKKLQNAFQVFRCKKKKKILAFSFQLFSTANSFYISFCEINLIKIQTMSLVLNPFYERLFVFYLLYVIIRQRLKKKFKLQQLNFFFNRANEIKTWSCAKNDIGHAQRSYFTVAQISIACWRSALSKKFDMSVKLFQKKPLRGVVENDVLKI